MENVRSAHDVKTNCTSGRVKLVQDGRQICIWTHLTPPAASAGQEEIINNKSDHGPPCFVKLTSKLLQVFFLTGKSFGKVQLNIWVIAAFQTKPPFRSAAHSLPTQKTQSAEVYYWTLWLNTSRKEQKTSRGRFLAPCLRSTQKHLTWRHSVGLRKNSLFIKLGSVRDCSHTKEAKKTTRSFSE